MKNRDLTGQVFGHLTVTKYDENMNLNKTIHNIDNLADMYLIYMVDTVNKRM